MDAWREAMRVWSSTQSRRLGFDKVNPATFHERLLQACLAGEPLGHLGWALTVETVRCTPTTGPVSTSIPAHHNPTKLRGSKAFHRQPLRLQRHASRHRLSSLKSQSAVPRGGREWLHDAQRLSLDFDEPRHENGHDVAMGSWDTRCPTLCSKSKRLLSLADKGRSKIKPTKIPGLHVKKICQGSGGFCHRGIGNTNPL